MVSRTKARVAIPVRRYGRVPPVPSELREERQPMAAVFLLTTAALMAAAAIYTFW
jgi:hypothetical protein